MKCILPTPLVRLVDDDNDFRESQKAFLTALGWQVEDWESPAAFLQDDDLQRPGCAVLDIRMPGMTGLDLQRRFVEAGSRLPVIFLTGHGDVATAVHTMKYGALDFLEKRGDPMVLAAAVERACKKSLAAAKAAAEAQSYQAAYDALTPREREVFVLAAKGLSNKEAAEVLGIGAETVRCIKLMLMPNWVFRVLSRLISGWKISRRRSPRMCHDDAQNASHRGRSRLGLAVIASGSRS